VKPLKEKGNRILNELNSDLNNTERKGEIYGVFETSLTGKNAEQKNLLNKS
jgi:hypothetical protein